MNILQKMILSLKKWERLFNYVEKELHSNKNKKILDMDDMRKPFNVVYNDLNDDELFFINFQNSAIHSEAEIYCQMVHNITTKYQKINRQKKKDFLLIII